MFDVCFTDIICNDHYECAGQHLTAFSGKIECTRVNSFTNATTRKTVSYFDATDTYSAYGVINISLINSVDSNALLVW